VTCVGHDGRAFLAVESAMDGCHNAKKGRGYRHCSCLVKNRFMQEEMNRFMEEEMNLFLGSKKWHLALQKPSIRKRNL
jgi:hypothetical protein